MLNVFKTSSFSQALTSFQVYSFIDENYYRVNKKNLTHIIKKKWRKLKIKIIILILIKKNLNILLFYYLFLDYNIPFSK